MLNCQKGMGNAVWMGRLSWAGKREDYVFFLGREPWGELCMKCAVLDGSWRLSSTFKSQGSRWFGQFWERQLPFQDDKFSCIGKHISYTFSSHTIKIHQTWLDNIHFLNTRFESNKVSRLFMGFVSVTLLYHFKAIRPSSVTLKNWGSGSMLWVCSEPCWKKRSSQTIWVTAPWQFSEFWVVVSFVEQTVTCNLRVTRNLWLTSFESWKWNIIFI